MKFNVIRAHIGDKAYAEGDIREADEKTVVHLVPSVLQPVGSSSEKAEAPHSNKAESAAPANKAVTGRKAKN